MLEFQPDQSPRTAHRALKASLQTMEKALKDASADKSGQTPLLPLPRSHPAAVVPVCVSLEMSPTQFARYETLWAQIRKQSNVPTDKVEALLEIMAVFPGKSATRVDAGPPFQIHIPPAQGGSNNEDNLTTLCSACHRLAHEKGSSWARDCRPEYYFSVPVPIPNSHRYKAATPATRSFNCVTRESGFTSLASAPNPNTQFNTSGSLVAENSITIRPPLRRRIF